MASYVASMIMLWDFVVSFWFIEHKKSFFVIHKFFLFSMHTTIILIKDRMYVIIDNHFKAA